MKIEMYTGYIRNWETLCEKLDISMRGGRDQIEREILLRGMERWGMAVCERLCGAFAFVIYDEATDTRYCARDHFGLRRFYYYPTENGEILFGTDVHSITRDPRFVKRLDRDALRLYMTFGYLAGERTMYQGLRKLMPGHYMICRGGKFDIRRYFEPVFAPDYAPSEADWIREIEDAAHIILSEDRTRPAVRNAVSFLSGGVDSSYLLALNGVERAYGIGFSDASRDETADAAETAKALGRRFEKKQIDAREYFDSIPRTIRAMELPLADASAVAFSIGCREAAQSAELLFSGEGVDEFFAGYWIYQRADALEKTVGDSYRGCMGVMDEQTARNFLKDPGDAVDDCSLFGNVFPKHAAAEEYASQLLETDIRLFLEGDILFNVSCAVADNSVEILTPFLDPRMFAVAARIPAAYKLRDGRGKYIFRKTAERLLPSEAAWRKKIGFAVPVRMWLADEALRGEIEERLFGRVSQMFFRQEPLRRVWNNYLAGNQEIWMIPYAAYVFAVWYETCFEADDSENRISL